MARFDMFSSGKFCLGAVKLSVGEGGRGSVRQVRSAYRMLWCTFLYLSLFFFLCFSLFDLKNVATGRT